MNNTLQQDLELTLGIVNYLNASYRGKFAALNMLSQLAYRGFNNEELLRTEKVLETINRWQKDLWQQLPLLSVSWKTPETFDGKRSLDLAREMMRELEKVITTLEKILERKEITEPDELKFLVAAYGRYAYGRDNYVKGFIEFGKNFARPDLVQEYSRFLDAANEDVQRAHSYLKGIKQEKLPPDFTSSVFAATRRLPTTFRMHLHDLNQLSRVFEGEFTYEAAGFSRGEGQRWFQGGFSPKAAGYWRAHQISPEDAAGWAQGGINDPNAATGWVDHGFDPATALQWVQIGIGPDSALAWQRGGYTPQEATSYIEKGINDPTTLESKA